MEHDGIWRDANELRSVLPVVSAGSKQSVKGLGVQLSLDPDTSRTAENSGETAVRGPHGRFGPGNPYRWRRGGSSPNPGGRKSRLAVEADWELAGEIAAELLAKEHPEWGPEVAKLSADGRVVLAIYLRAAHGDVGAMKIWMEYRLPATKQRSTETRILLDRIPREEMERLANEAEKTLRRKWSGVDDRPKLTDPKEETPVIPPELRHRIQIGGGETEQT